MVKTYEGVNIKLWLPIKACPKAEEQLFYSSEADAIESLGGANVGDKVVCITSYKSWMPDEDAEAILQELDSVT